MAVDSGTGVTILTTDTCWGRLGSSEVGRLAVRRRGKARKHDSQQFGGI